MPLWTWAGSTNILTKSEREVDASTSVVSPTSVVLGDYVGLGGLIDSAVEASVLEALDL
jgi:hypothetical protein